jgi:hemin uptake protein HemP
MKLDSVALPTERVEENKQRHVAVVGGAIDSRELFQDSRELRILHGGAIYRLRLTGLNKLILTK